MTKSTKSLSNMAAPIAERIKGSKVNAKNSAASKQSARQIKLDANIINVLESKKKLHNEKHPDDKVTLPTLKAVFRRGAGAYSSSHRPTISGGKPNSRTAWAYARVNKFLEKKAGKTVKKAYVQDDDLMEMGGYTKVSKFSLGGDVEVERFENDGRLGEYYAPKGEGYEGYGKNKKVSIISKDANVVVINSSERYLKSKGDKITEESVAKKLGTNIWSEAFDKMNTEDLANTEIADIEKYTKVIYREAQLAVKDFVLKENPKIDVIKFTMEDEVNPTQYWVLNKNVLKDKVAYVQDDDLLAPNGKPSNLTPEQYKLVRTPEFKAWFGDWENDPENASKVVDDNGEPLVVYHGTNVPNINIFKESYDGGYWFTSKYEVAKDFAQNNNLFGNTIIYNVFLKINNPYISNLKGEFLEHSKDTFDTIKEVIDGIDGFILKNALDYIENPIVSDIFNCFYSNQIKLADGSNVTFDANNPDIRYAKGGQVKPLAPNGQPSNLTPEQYKLVRTPEFKAWFGDWENDPKNASKVVDDNGEPMPVYHGTPFGRFNKFEKMGLVDDGWLGLGFYFHKKKEQATSYSLRGVDSNSSPYVFEVFLNIRKLFFYEKYKLSKKLLLNNEYEADTNIEKFDFDRFEEYDDEGFKNNKKDWLYIQYKESEDAYDIAEYMSYLTNRSQIISDLGYQGVNIGDEFVCYRPNQIKLADGSNTTFDANNPDIRYAKGGQVALLAPNGKPSNLTPEQYRLVRTPEFKAWFGDWENDPENASKVVDYNGEPLVVYHGSETKKFNKFLQTTQGVKVDRDIIGFYFSDLPDVAYTYTYNDYYEKYMGKNYVRAFFLNIRKIKTKDASDKRLGDPSFWDNKYDKIVKSAFNNKYDGVLIKNIIDLLQGTVKDKTDYEFWGNTYVVFDPNNIKLADGSNVTFDSNNPDIRYAEGGQVHLLAPNGKPSNLTPEQYKLVRTPEFKAWFGDWENDPENASKVVDDNGEPLVVYHGTFRDFTTFDLKKVGNTDKGYFSKGFYFTPIKSLAYYYGNKILQCFLSIKNPIHTKSRINLANYLGFDAYEENYSEMARNKIISFNHDGVFNDYNLGYGQKALFPFIEVVAYYPEQIKLADGSNMTFDGNNPDIRYAKGGQVHLLAPNGKPSNLTPEQYTLVRTPEFKAWFGDWENDPENASKVVDENGEPQICYHGSNKKFTTFQYKALNDYGFLGVGFYFTNLRNWAEAYSTEYQNEIGEPILYEVFLNIRKPYKMTKYDSVSKESVIEWTEHVKNINKDGVVYMTFVDDEISINRKYNEWVAFYPEQIKLADGSNVTFNGNIPDIRYAEGGTTDYSDYVTSVIALYYNNKVLILKRGSTAPWMPNKWSLVGGGVEPNENPQNAIIRECEEEIGLTPVNVEFIKKINTEDVGQIYYYKGELNDDKVILDYENSDYAFISKNELNNFEYIPYVKDFILNMLENNTMNNPDIIYSEGGKIENDEITKELNGVIQLIGKKYYIVKGQYKNQKKHQLELIELFKSLNYQIFDVDKASTTNSRYFNFEKDGIFGEVRLSDHTKPEYRTLRPLDEELRDYTLIKVKDIGESKSVEINILSTEDFEYIKKWLMNLTDKYAKGGIQKLGDCYQAAGDIIFNHKLSFSKINFIGEPYLVHAEVKGQGKIEGIRYGHAWIEDDENVYDFSNGRRIIMSKYVYYLLGDVNTDNPKKYKRYTFAEASRKMTETKNYGSWDIETKYAEGGQVHLLAPNGKPSNLTPKQYMLVRTPEFKAWFGDWENDPENASKVVDDNGEPMVMWHYSKRLQNESDKFYEFRVDMQLGSHFGTLKQSQNLKFLESGESKVNTPNKELIDFKYYQVFLNIKNQIRVKDVGFFYNVEILDYIDIALNRNDYYYINDYTNESKDSRLDRIKYILKNNYGYDGLVYLNRFESDAEIELINRLDDYSDEYFKKEVPSAEDSWIAFYPNQIKLADGSNMTFDANNPDIRYDEGGSVGKHSFIGKYDNLYQFISRNDLEQTFSDKYGINIDDWEDYTHGNFGSDEEVIKLLMGNGYKIFYNEGDDEFVITKKKTGKLEYKINTITDKKYYKKVLDIIKDSGIYSEYEPKFAVFVGKKIVGGSTAFVDEDNVYNFDIGILDEYQGFGISKELIEKIIAHAKEMNAKEIKAYVVNDMLFQYLGGIGFNLSRDSDEKYAYMPLKKSKKKFDDGGLLTISNSTLIAPNGKPSNLTPEQYNLVRTPAFKAWFGDWQNDPENASKVVDENGEPLICNHSSLEKDIDIFDGGRIFMTELNKVKPIWFTYSKGSVYADGKDILQYKCYLNIRNLFDYSNQKNVKDLSNYFLKMTGKKLPEYDFNWDWDAQEVNNLPAYIFEMDFDGYKFSDENSVVVFNSKQIKLADGSNTTFDMNNPDIRYAEGGQVKPLAPNGKPSNLTPEQYNLVRTPEFKAWFGDWMKNPNNASKVVDENGEPLVCLYNSNNDYHLYQHKSYLNAFFFTPYKSDGDFDWRGSKIISVFLNIKTLSVLSNIPKEFWSKPYYENKWIEESLKDERHQIKKTWDETVFIGHPNSDGIKFIKEVDKKEMIVAFNPNQIKLSDGSNVTFNPKKSDTRYAEGGQVKLLAPNGQPSNLTPEQYKIVRTPEFKAWFGDWENDPENASKVVDENGEPLMVHHGTNNNFTIFDKSKLGEKNFFAESALLGFFFAKNIKTSEAYTGMNSMDMAGVSFGAYDNVVKKYESQLEDVKKKMRYIYDRIMNEEKAKTKEKIKIVAESIKHLGYSDEELSYMFESAGEKIDYHKISELAAVENEANGNLKKFELLNKELLKEIEEEWKIKTGSNPRIIRSFLNIKNPHIIDYANIEEISLPLDIKKAISNKNDGVIFNNLADGAEKDDIFVVFEPNQIKLADGSNMTFDDNNPDIRYEDGGNIHKDITCVNCGWQWNTADSDESDKYVCHQCGFDNRTYYDADFIGKYEKGGDVDCIPCAKKAELGMKVESNDEYKIKRINKSSEEKDYSISEESNKEGDKIKQPKSIQEIARKHRFPMYQLQQNLKTGIKIELEHTSDEKIAEKIALHHLYERPDYYQQLELVESMEWGGIADNSIGYNIGKYYDENAIEMSHYLMDEKDLSDYILSSKDNPLHKYLIMDSKYQNALNMLNNENNPLVLNLWNEVKNIWANAIKKLNTIKKSVQSKKNEKNEKIILKDGGLAYGNSHDKGGIKLYNKGANSNIEIEGGEGVINKRSMQMSEKLNFEGEKLSACEIISKINEMGGGVKFKCSDVKLIINNDGKYI